jgi:DNA-binding response OmpR family regulator
LARADDGKIVIWVSGQDGLSLIQELRSSDTTRDTPVVVVSAKADLHSDALSGGAFGVLDCLSKPVDAERLLAVIGQVARQVKSR